MLFRSSARKAAILLSRYKTGKIEQARIPIPIDHAKRTTAFKGGTTLIKSGASPGATVNTPQAAGG